ncbi:hypothetical protein DQP58_26230 [Mycobacterium colombiense]|uniref:Uncharacterized protein n=2 Tax=Mycobacterium colombiense TaxID=339268 RepID=A0A329K2C4_9MYCO|nr:hypothetical protein DQP58_26230 [Mycobacterium colombiense]
MRPLCCPPRFARGAGDGSARAWPVAMPALLWVTLVLDLPLVPIIVMALASTTLSHLIVRVCGLNEAGDFGRNADNAAA